MPHSPSNNPTDPTLRRDLGVFGAVMLGMGSIIGTGAFVSIGIAAGVAGPAVVLGIFLAALLAAANGLSSAQLAANHAVSGGTYEYGYQYANPVLGFTAGWMFLFAKSASAATAALGFAGYLLLSLNLDHVWLVPTALAVLIALIIVVLSGMKRTNVTNIIIVSITLATLAFFIIAGLPRALDESRTNFTPFIDPIDETAMPGIVLVLHAAALMFVAYTGYGRIATMGEEIREPKRNIPIAIIITLGLSMLIYMLVAIIGIGAVGAGLFAEATEERAAPLQVIAETFPVPGAGYILAVGAVTAMLGVLLNLLLGLSRVLLAMGRRGDMPRATARLNRAQTAPTIAVIAVACVIGLLVLLGDVRVAWSFSAFTVLIYYAITNWCAIKLPREKRLYPVWIAWCGLVACLALTVFIDWRIALAGLAVIAVGLQWHGIARHTSKRSPAGRG